MRSFLSRFVPKRALKPPSSFVARGAPSVPATAPPRPPLVPVVPPSVLKPPTLCAAPPLPPVQPVAPVTPPALVAPPPPALAGIVPSLVHQEPVRQFATQSRDNQAVRAPQKHRSAVAHRPRSFFDDIDDLFFRHPFDAFEDSLGLSRSGDFFDGFGLSSPGTFGHAHEWANVPAMKVVNGDNQLVVSVDVPGVKKADLKVSITGDEVKTLTVSGSRREVKLLESKEASGDKADSKGDKADGKQSSSEESSMKFSRSIQLPKEAVVEKIEAKHEDGVLTLTIPKEAKEVNKPAIDVPIS